MKKLGRLHTLRDAKLDALRLLRDSVTRLQSQNCDDLAEIKLCRTALDRLEELSKL